MISNAEDDVRNVKEAKNPVRKIHSRELLQRSNDSAMTSLLKELGGKRKTAPVRVAPPKMFRIATSSVLSRARCFLPEMEKADVNLRERIADEQLKQGLDIEIVEDGEPCIEMDMALMPMRNEDADSESSEEDKSKLESEECPSGWEKSCRATSLDCDASGEIEKTFTLRLPLSRSSSKKPVLVEEVT